MREFFSGNGHRLRMSGQFSKFKYLKMNSS